MTLIRLCTSLFLALVILACVLSCSSDEIHESGLTNDTTEAVKLYTEAWELRNINPDICEQKSLRAIELSKKTDFKKGLGRGHLSLACVYRMRGDYEKAVESLDQTINYSSEIRDQLGLAHALNVKGLTLVGMGKYNEADEQYNNALPLFIKLKDIDGESRVYANLGTIQLHSSNYKKAAEYYLRCLKIREQLPDSTALSTAYLNVGIVYTHLTDYDMGDDYYSKALEVAKNNKYGQLYAYLNKGVLHYRKKDYVKSREYHNKALTISIELKDKFAEANQYNNIGTLEYEAGNIDLAIQYFLKNIAQLESISSTRGKMDSYFNLAAAYRDKKDFKSALQVTEKMYAEVSKGSSKKELMNCYLSFFEIYNGLGNYKKAYQYHGLSLALKDSIYSQDQLRISREMAEKYESEKKASQILHQKQHIRQLENENKIKNLQLFSVLSISLTLFTIAYSVHRHQRTKSRKERELRQANEIVMQQKAALLEADLKAEKLSRDILQKEVSHKDQEMINLANYIVEKNDFLDELEEKLSGIGKSPEIAKEELQKILVALGHYQRLDKSKDEFLNHIQQISNSFYLKLDQYYPDLTQSEKRLCALIRLDLSSKQISVILGITAKSVDMSRYRLRKKMDLPEDISLGVHLNSVLI